MIGPDVDEPDNRDEDYYDQAKEDRVREILEEGDIECLPR